MTEPNEERVRLSGHVNLARKHAGDAAVLRTILRAMSTPELSAAVRLLWEELLLENESLDREIDAHFFDDR